MQAIDQTKQKTVFKTNFYQKTHAPQVILAIKLLIDDNTLISAPKWLILAFYFENNMKNKN